MNAPIWQRPPINWRRGIIRILMVYAVSVLFYVVPAVISDIASAGCGKVSSGYYEAEMAKDWCRQKPRPDCPAILAAPTPRDTVRKATASEYILCLATDQELVKTLGILMMATVAPLIVGVVLRVAIWVIRGVAK